MTTALLAALLLLPAAASAQESAAFLTLGAGARADAMGGAYTAVGDDVEAVAANPAGLAGLDAAQLSVSDAESIANTRFDSIGFAHPGPRGTFAVSAGYLSPGTIPGRDASGAPTGGYNASDLAAGASYAARLPGLPEWSLGAGAEYVKSVIADASAQTFALDAGARYQARAPWGPGVPMAGLSVRNAGPGLRFLDQRSPLPLTVALGAGYRLPSGLLLDVDYKRRPLIRVDEVDAGAEYALLKGFALRAGYASALAPAGGGGADEVLSGFTAGFGLALSAWTLNYAMAPMGELGRRQTFSLNARF